MSARLDPPPSYEVAAGDALPAVAFTLTLLQPESWSAPRVELKGAATELIELAGVELWFLLEDAPVPVRTYAARLLSAGADGYVFAFEDLPARQLDTGPVFCFIGLRGRAVSEGSGPLLVRVSAADGEAEAVVEVRVTPRVRLPVLPQRPAPPAPIFGNLLERWAGVYFGRSFAAGWVGFDGSFDSVAELLLVHAEALGLCVLEAGGAQTLQVTLVSQGAETRLRPLPHEYSLVATDTLETLGRLSQEGLLRLRAETGAGEVVVISQPAADPRLTPAAREAQRELLGRAIRLTPVEMYWNIPRPAEGEAFSKLVRVTLALLEEACALDFCVGAAATAAGPPLQELPSPFAYELLAGTASASNRLGWVRSHVRTPGWRTLVPRLAMERSPAAGFSGVETEAGFLVEAPEPDPFSVSDSTMSAVEQFVLPYVGSASEAERYHAGGGG